MKSITKWRCYITGAIVITVAFVMAGCLANNQALQAPATVQVGLELGSIGSGNIITAGDDEIAVTRLRLLHGASFFSTDADSLFLLNNFSLPNVEEFTPQSNMSRSLVDGNFVEGRYQLLNIKFPAAAEEDSAAVDPEFIDGGNYSMIIEGTYNGESFTYNSSRSFETIHNFSPALDVPEFNAAYVFLVSADAADWFAVNEGDSLLNPSDSTNSQMIDDNIAASIDISVVQENSLQQ